MIRLGRGLGGESALGRDKRFEAFEEVGRSLGEWAGGDDVAKVEELADEDLLDDVLLGGGRHACREKYEVSLEPEESRKWEREAV